MWIQPLFLTFQLIAVSVTIAAIVGIAAAWASWTLESSGRMGRVLAGLMTATMVASVALPMILHAASWEATAGKFGWLPLTQTGTRASGLTAFGAFGGLVACGWIHGLVGAGIVALATRHGLRTTPRRVLEQARLENSPSRLWWRVRLPLAMPWIVAAMLATAVLAATEMTVVDLYGFRTIADEFYLYYAVDPTWTSLVMTWVVPILISLVLMAVLKSIRRERLTVRGRVGEIACADRPGLSAVTLAMLIFVFAVSLILFVPVFGLLIKMGHHVQVRGDVVEVDWSAIVAIKTMAAAPATFADEYRWTALIAVLTGTAAVALGWPLAAWGRTGRRVENLIDVASIIFVTIPGPIVGLAVVRMFRTDWPAFNTLNLDALYQRTLIPTVIALLFRAGPLAYWVLRAGYRSMDRTLLDASRLDSTVWRRMWSIDRRMLGTHFVVAFAASCVVASGDVPATLPVIPAGVTTVGTRLFGLLHSGARQQEAALAIWYVGAVVVCVMVGLASAAHRVDRSTRT